MQVRGPSTRTVGVGLPATAWKVIAMDKKSNLLIILVTGIIAIALLFVAVSVG
ncbi:hypothetical protein AB0I53_13735 [Saccharopolyspora sp. NPDC050389]|uniref:hypothetical protein n=1 Tax=Saccharopolyspora sp. NPDC050389 TaxID=3155516 RepID=UPI0033F63CDE